MYKKRRFSAGMIRRDSLKIGYGHGKYLLPRQRTAPGGTVDSAVHAAAQKARIGGVHNGVKRTFRNISPDKLKRRHIHKIPPV
jgi:hypothetical protein